MSRREGRETDSRRHRSRYHREPRYNFLSFFIGDVKIQVDFVGLHVWLKMPSQFMKNQLPLKVFRSFLKLGKCNLLKIYKLLSMSLYLPLVQTNLSSSLRKMNKNISFQAQHMKTVSWKCNLVRIHLVHTFSWKNSCTYSLIHALCNASAYCCILYCNLMLRDLLCLLILLLVGAYLWDWANAILVNRRNFSYSFWLHVLNYGA